MSEMKAAEKELVLGKLAYVAKADWLILRKKEKPAAELFYVFYRAKDPAAKRPVTFVFNGGPGAASAYLHMGALGPKRVVVNSDGTLPKPPATLVDNLESWLPFTDLVFVDPVGTGFSRIVRPEEDKKESAPKEAKSEPVDENEFYKLERDLQSLGEFISKFLSQAKAWSRPCFIAGESYGGFRVAKLARRLQEDFGVGLNGAILISPALELSLLEGSDYNLAYWSDLFPSLALSALHHKKSLALAEMGISEARIKVEAFAVGELLSILAQGDSPARSAGFAKIAQFLGLSEKFVRDNAGRISAGMFTRELLRSERSMVGLYDASIKSIDPFPNRENFQGADPTLFSIQRAFTGAINSQLREVLGLETDRDYHLLSMDVNNAWKSERKHDFESPAGSTDDLRYGMALNEHMKVFITHGLYDLITPYYASERIANSMKLAPSQVGNLTVKHYPGGHMFYAWEESRKQFRDDMVKFYGAAI